MRIARWTPHTRVSFLPLRAEALAHERETHRAIAQRLAAMLDCDFVADATPGSEACYVVPDDTITSLDAARRFAIDSEHDLFGGVVPWPYMASKTISHPLVHPGAAAPEGWCAEFPRCVADVVLPGYSAFAKEDAAAAARTLLRSGPVRLKLASGIGGTGQTVVEDERQLEPALAALADEDVQQGLAVELNLSQVRTFSVGRLRIGSMQACYVGEQSTTPNRDGIEVYGGSELMFARGGFTALMSWLDGADMRRAIRHASRYHRAAMRCLRGMFASRCNYDVAQGIDAHGVKRMGVLEQSWRIGGASGAELAALQAFANDASLRTARACTVERHANVDIPERATIYFQGTDPHVGPITKYALLHQDDVPRGNH